MTSKHEHRTGPLTQTGSGLHRVTCLCGWSATAAELDGLSAEVSEHLNPGRSPEPRPVTVG